MSNLSNPNWYSKEVEARVFRDIDMFEIGCDCCGYRYIAFDRRWPKNSFILGVLEKGCSCE